MKNDREIYRQKLIEYSKEYSIIPTQNNLNQFNKVMKSSENEQEIKEDGNVSKSIIEKINYFISFYIKYIVFIILTLICALIISVFIYIKNNDNINNNYNSDDKWSVVIDYLKKNIIV